MALELELRSVPCALLPDEFKGSSGRLTREIPLEEFWLWAPAIKLVAQSSVTVSNCFLIKPAFRFLFQSG
jgi:hypothetical protein